MNVYLRWGSPSPNSLQKGMWSMDTNADMVMMKAGKMILLVGGDMLIMQEDVLTADGTQVKTDGTIILPDGTISKMAEDAALIIDRMLTRIEEG